MSISQQQVEDRDRIEREAAGFIEEFHKVMQEHGIPTKDCSGYGAAVEQFNQTYWDCAQPKPIKIWDEQDEQNRRQHFFVVAYHNALYEYFARREQGGNDGFAQRMARAASYLDCFTYIGEEYDDHISLLPYLNHEVRSKLYWENHLRLLNEEASKKQG